MNISASIVLYKNPVEEIQRLISCFFNSSISGRLYLVDNSPTNALSSLKSLDKRIIYQHFPENPGFGSGHNFALKKEMGSSDFHFLINPDILFESDALEKLVKFGAEQVDTGLIMPKIVYPNGEDQFLAKLLPDPIILIVRRMGIFNVFFEKYLSKYELRLPSYQKALKEAPFLSGCFLMVNMKYFDESLLFDEKYFMYFEDVDFCRSFINKGLKTKYYDGVAVVHDHVSKSFFIFSNMKMYLSSAIIYFNKWGWFYDKRRSHINKNTLKQFVI